jgi:hypothetical protein
VGSRRERRTAMIGGFGIDATTVHASAPCGKASIGMKSPLFRRTSG